MTRNIQKMVNDKKIVVYNDAEVDKIINELAKNSEKPKSKIFEKAIRVMKNREDEIYARMEDYVNNGADSLLDFEELVSNRKAGDLR